MSFTHNSQTHLEIILNPTFIWYSFGCCHWNGDSTIFALWILCMAHVKLEPGEEVLKVIRNCDLHQLCEWSCSFWNIPRYLGSWYQLRTPNVTFLSLLRSRDPGGDIVANCRTRLSMLQRWNTSVKRLPFRRSEWVCCWNPRPALRRRGADQEMERLRLRPRLGHYRALCQTPSVPRERGRQVLLSWSRLSPFPQ